MLSCLLYTAFYTSSLAYYELLRAQCLIYIYCHAYVYCIARTVLYKLCTVLFAAWCALFDTCCHALRIMHSMRCLIIFSFSLECKSLKSVILGVLDTKIYFNTENRHCLVSKVVVAVNTKNLNKITKN